MAELMVATAILSALVLNDTIALLMTPIVVRSTRALRINPVPYLIALAIAVNVGSVATEIGNPQNAFIGIRSGIPFLRYTAAMLPVMVACLAVSIGLVWLVFRRDFRAPIAPSGPLKEPELQKHGLLFTLVVIAVSVGAFALSSPAWLPLTALAGGALVLFFLPFASTADSRTLIGKVDWSILLFFIGLFVVMGGVQASGLSVAIQDGFISLFGDQETSPIWLTGLSALLSNLISNVPAVLLLAEVVQGAGGSMPLWLALASSSTLAGNAMILSAAANVIIVQSAAREGVEVSLVQFVKAGLPVTAATLVLSTFLLAILVPA